MAPKRPKFSTQKRPDRFKTQLLSQVSQNVFGKSLSTSLNILCFHFLKVCVVCVKFIFLSPSLKFYWRIHCKPKKPNFFNLGPLCLPTPVVMFQTLDVFFNFLKNKKKYWFKKSFQQIWEFLWNSSLEKNIFMHGTDFCILCVW